VLGSLGGLGRKVEKGVCGKEGEVRAYEFGVLACCYTFA
jgi:hypothetical protein